RHAVCPRKSLNRGRKAYRALTKRRKGPLSRPFSCACRGALLDLDRRAGLFELRLDLVGLVLRDAFLDRVWRAVDEILGLLEAEAGDGPNDLDRLVLLVAGVRQHDVEGGLLLRRCGAVAARRRRAGSGTAHRS